MVAVQHSAVGHLSAAGDTQVRLFTDTIKKSMGHAINVDRKKNIAISCFKNNEI